MKFRRILNKDYTKEEWMGTSGELGSGNVFLQLQENFFPGDQGSNRCRQGIKKTRHC